MNAGLCPRCGNIIPYVNPRTPLCPRCGASFFSTPSVPLRSHYGIPQMPYAPAFPQRSMLTGTMPPGQPYQGFQVGPMAPAMSYGAFDQTFGSPDDASAKKEGNGWTIALVILSIVLLFVLVAAGAIVASQSSAPTGTSFGSSGIAPSNSGRSSGSSTFASNSITGSANVTNVEGKVVDGAYLLTGTLRNTTSKRDSFIVVLGLYDSRGKRLGTAIGVTSDGELSPSSRGEFGCLARPVNVDFPLTRSNIYELASGLYDILHENTYFSASYRVDSYSFIGAVSWDYVVKLANEVGQGISYT